MRVLRLDLGSARVELHPYLTVVRGMAPELRQRLLEVMAGLPAGRTAVGGLIEAHGVILDLAPATLALLDLDAPLDVVVRATDVPARNTPEPLELAAARREASSAADDRATAEAALADATSQRDVARQAVAATAGGKTPMGGEGASGSDIEAAGMARADAEGRVEAAATAAAEARAMLAETGRAAGAAGAEQQDAIRAVSVAVAALEAGGRRRDAAAAAAVDAAQRRLADAEDRLTAVRGGVVASDDGTGAPADAHALKADRLALEAALLALDSTDPLPVRRALERLRSEGGQVLVTSEEAATLADRWSILDVDLRAAGVGTGSDPGTDDTGTGRMDAHRAVEAAELVLAEAEAAARSGGLAPADIDELEVAHAAVMEVREASEKRFGGAKAARRIEEVVAAEQAILDRLGFLTYSSYRMGARLDGGVDGGVGERLEAARQALAAAEEAHARREGATADELARAALIDQRRQLRAEAVALLGTDPGDDVEGALRRHRVPASATGEHLVRLRHALEATGLVLVDEDLDERLLTDLAGVWLSEQAETEEQRNSLQQRIAAADVELAELVTRERAPGVAEPLARAAAAVQEAEVALRSAETRLARDAEVVRDIDALRDAFDAATAAEERAGVEVAAADATVAEAAAALAACIDGLRAAEAEAVGAGDAEDAARARFADLASRVSAAKADGLGSAEADLVACEREVEEAQASAAAARRAEAVAQAALAAAESLAVAAGQTVRLDGAADRDVEDVEWYLLARLAAQRSVSYAGSVPLVLDDALAAFDHEAALGILGRLERMASTVQVVVVTEDLWIAGWAEGLGAERAHVTSG